MKINRKTRVLIRLEVLEVSKYTTEVRFICEQKSGLSESVGCNDVDAVIASSWDKIFTSKVSFFDEAYRSVICSKILKHYYLREIGCETVGIWVLWMNTRLEEIMPYYNQLYESARIKFEPLEDVNITRKHNITGVENRTQKSDTDSTVNSDVNTTGTRRDLYSDTPQGAITGLESETYLTNARKITDETNTGTAGNTNVTENVNGTNNTTEDYLETVTGKQGTQSFSKLLNEFRTTLLNIDMQVIEEFSDLFMGLW